MKIKQTVLMQQVGELTLVRNENQVYAHVMLVH